MAYEQSAAFNNAQRRVRCCSSATPAPSAGPSWSPSTLGTAFRCVEWNDYRWSRYFSNVVSSRDSLPTWALSGTHPQKSEKPETWTPSCRPRLFVPHPRPPTSSALDLERFIRRTVARGAASPDTIEGYLREARLFRDRFLAPRGLSIGDVRPRDVETYRRELFEAGYTPITIGAKLTALRRLLAAAVDAGVLPANPAVGIGAPVDRREPGAAAERALTLEELRRLTSARSPVRRRSSPATGR